MDWFLYDNGLRHEKVKIISNNMRVLRRCYRTVPSSLWEIFSEFLNLFHDPLGKI